MTTSWHLVLKELLTALIPGRNRLYRKPRSVEVKSGPLSTGRVGRQGKTFQILKKNTFFFFLFAK